MIATRQGLAVVVVELADTPGQIQQGLMFRRYLHPDAGMLFRMGRTAVFEFYMRNTVIALDMIFIGDDLRVVGVVHGALPLSEARRGVGLPSAYVLEVNAGWARDHQVTPGDPVQFVGMG